MNETPLSLDHMQCNKHDAQRTFLEQIISGQDKVALIGCGCSLATEPVAEISRFWNITHVSSSIINVPSHCCMGKGGSDHCLLSLPNSILMLFECRFYAEQA